MPNRVVHFEIEAADKMRAKKFYEEAFDWKMDVMGENMGGYVTITTGAPNEPGGINGGMYQDPKKQYNAYRCVIAVDDIQKAINDVKAAGGKIEEHNLNDKGEDMGQIMDIPTVGKWAKCEDTEGNVFSILQPSMEMIQGKK